MSRSRTMGARHWLGCLALIPLGCESTPGPSAAGPSSVGTRSTPTPSAESARGAEGGEGATLEVGDSAPSVTFTLHDGKQVPLATLVGVPVVVYFYPKDDTPGCTVEAQGIRDAHAEFEKAKIRVFGVSTQGAESHQQFIQKYELPFDLVVDEGAEVAKAFGVPLRGQLASRQTFAIGADGKIKKIWRQVDPSGHAQEILAVLR